MQSKPVRTLFNNTALAYISNIVVKVGNSLLFIFIGRILGPTDAGVFNLGITFFTVTLAFSDWGLHELLVREVAPRRDESGRYLVNYLAMRTILAVIAYVVLLILLYLFLPYQSQTETVILILGLAVLPEAIFALLQAQFVAHEQLQIPTLAAIVYSSIKIGAGLWLLNSNAPITTIAWVIPIGSILSLLVFLPGLFRLLRQVPQKVTARLDLSFSLSQLRYTPGFILISTFLTLDFQLDTFLISLFLDETNIGWYGAAQTIMLGFMMMASAIRTTLYPLMARTYKENPERLASIYSLAHQYLLLVALPIATGISLLAKPIVHLIYTDSFDPTIPALQIMIWAVVFAFINVPNARLLLVHNRQQPAGWMTGISMVTNLLLNLWLIPRLGIVGAAIARTTATAVLFLQLYGYAQLYLRVESILSLLVRPILATLIMALVVWPLRQSPLLLPILAGLITYVLAAYIVGAIPPGMRRYLNQCSPFAARQ